MRNLAEYPITTKEVVELLERYKAECDPELVGDMRPTLLEEAICRVLEYDYSRGGKAK